MHVLLNVIKKVINKHFMSINRYTLMLLVGGYVMLSGIGLVLARESNLTESIISFIYYIVTTSSTVGYGDLSPTTAYGQLFAALFIIPCGVSLFALLIGKIAVFFY